MRPKDGNWVISPNKIWELIKADGDARAAFAFFQIDSRLTELLGVFDRSKQMIDDLAGPVMAMQGQEAPSYLDTARGASIAYNAANIWMRRAVRNWDDDISSELPTRFIDWNMQYNPKQEIKGDLLATARGTSTLLEAEGQANKMGIFMKAAEGIPMPFKRKIAQLKAMAKSMRLDVVDILPDDAEVKQLGDKIDNQPPPIQPEVERIKLRQAEIADNQAQREHEMQIKTMEFNLRAGEIASNNQITIEEANKRFGFEQFKVTAEMEDKREQRMHDAQALNAELATKMATGSGV
jgi:flagellar hook protein FlgE